ncbi:hypothetical protein [Prosthecobacter sp.]|uniref:hypothetical protein n=1 Tax=Prosthecobacter sp. TaxID=1965333 RepID=UPI003783C5A2
MKLKHPTSHLFTVAAPLCALTFSCLAQTVPPPVVPPVRAEATESVVTVRVDPHATGNISAMDSGNLTLVNDLGSQTVYLLNSDTEFMDKSGQAIAPSSLTTQTPITVYYTQVGSALLATKVVVSGTLFSDGVLTEIGPDALVIQMPDAPAAPVRYIQDTATKVVDMRGKAVKVLAPGDPVRVFYARAGNAMVATKIEVLGPNGSGVPTGVKTRTTTTTTTEETRTVKR